MSLGLFNASSPQHCGAMTSGGTESILMAVKAYRDRARANGNY
jgi:glutamate/tyrosine decarboxylase-like PLP-dependent enzyme